MLEVDLPLGIARHGQCHSRLAVVQVRLLAWLVAMCLQVEKIGEVRLHRSTMDEASNWFPNVSISRFPVNHSMPCKHQT